MTFYVKLYLLFAPPSALIFIEDNAADTLAAYGSALDPDAADSTLFGLASLLSGKKMYLHKTEKSIELCHASHFTLQMK